MAKSAKAIPPAVGIDLGTTFSVICKLDDLGRPQALINAEGDKITPSVVLFEGDNVVVGKEAAQAPQPGAQVSASQESGYRVTEHIEKYYKTTEV